MTSTHVIAYSRDVLIERTVHIIECWNCRIDFGIGDAFMQARREDHLVFYCPNGHGNYYTDDNTEEKLRKELEAARSLAQRESRRRTAAEADARHQDYRRRAAKGQLTRERKRIANGVCPCCNRTFAPLMEHIRSEHPDYVVPAEPPGS